MKAALTLATCLLVSATAPCAAAQDKAWLKPVIGDGYGVQVKEGRTSDRELNKIKNAGLTYVRFVIPWYEVEREQGSYDWGYFDKFVKRLRARGLKAVIVLGAGHPAYTGLMKAPANNLDQVEEYVIAPATPEAVAGFSKYAAETVAHFAGDDIVWELWNEPDIDRFWSPKANVKDYTIMAHQACLAMRKADPDAKIVAPGMADTPGHHWSAVPGFLGHVLKSPLLPCLDAISLHPYRDGVKPPETVLEAYQKLDIFLKKYTPPSHTKPTVLATEWGFTLTDTSPEEQAAFALRSFLLNSLAGVPVSIWYEWRDEREGPDDPEAHFGLLALDEVEKPSYKAVAAFLPPLKGSIIENRLEAGVASDYILLLRKPDGRHALVVWTSGTTKTILTLADQKAGETNEYLLTAMPMRIDLENNTPHYTVRRE